MRSSRGFAFFDDDAVGFDEEEADKGGGDEAKVSDCFVERGGGGGGGEVNDRFESAAVSAAPLKTASPPDESLWFVVSSGRSKFFGKCILEEEVGKGGSRS